MDKYQNAVLGIEKFRYPKKHYRLIWLDSLMGATFCELDTTAYTRKRDIVEAGKKIAEETKCKRFDERTR